MYSPVFLKTENELNKVLKTQKKTKEDMGILFVSLWDNFSKALLKKLRYRGGGSTKVSTKSLYIVDSFTMPHAFVIFKTTKLPHLVQLRKGSVESEDYLSKIYEALGL